MKKLLIIIILLANTYLLKAQTNDSIWAEILNDSTLHTGKQSTIYIHGIENSLDYSIGSPGFNVMRTDTINRFKVKTSYYKSATVTFTIWSKGTNQPFGKFNLPLIKSDDTTFVPLDSNRRKSFTGIARAPIYPENLEETIQKNFVFPKNFKSKKKGKILIIFSVSATGIVEEVKVVESDFSELNEAAIEAVKKLERFKPAIQNGNPVRFNMQVPISIN